MPGQAIGTSLPKWKPKTEKVVYLRRWCYECQKEYPAIFTYLETKSGVKRSFSPRKNDKCDEGHECVLQYREVLDDAIGWNNV